MCAGGTFWRVITSRHMPRVRNIAPYKHLPGLLCLVSSQRWFIPGLLVQLWKVGEVKGFLLKTSEIPVGTTVTDNDARPCTRIGGTMTLRYSPQSVFHCFPKNCTHAARHHSKLRCPYFQTECFLSRYAPQSLSFLSLGLYWGISHEPLTTSPLTSQPGTQATSNISQEMRWQKTIPG